MNERHVQEELILQFYGESHDSTREAVQEHLKGCSECRAYAADLKRLEGLLPRKPKRWEISPEKIRQFDNSILERFEKNRVEVREEWRYAGWVMGFGFSAVVGIIVMGVFFLKPLPPDAQMLADLPVLQNLELLEDLDLLEDLEIVEKM